MKKITFLLLLTSFLGFTQEFPLDFEDAADAGWGPFNGATVAIVDNGGDNYLELTSNGVDYDGASLNLGTAIDMSDDNNNTITFVIDPQDALGPTEVRTHLFKLEAGSTADTQLFFDTTGPNEQTISLNFGAGLGTYARVVLFMDSGNGNTATGTYWIDDIAGVPNAGPTCTDGIQNGDETGVDCGGSCPNACPALPTVAAPTPPNRAPGDVIAFYSDAYAQTSNWGEINLFGSTLTDVVVDGNNTYELVGPAGGGYQYNYFGPGGTSEDLSGMTHYHVDIWVEGSVAGGEVFTVQILNYDGADQLESNNFYQAPITATGEWISVDVPLSSFANAAGNTNYDRVRILQIIMQGPAYGPVYFDNLYFHNNQVLSTNDFELTDVSVYPNPSNNVWNVKTNNTVINAVQVFDVLGKQVMTLTPESTEVKIDASTLNTGLYIAKIATPNGVSNVRLVKN